MRYINYIIPVLLFLSVCSCRKSVIKPVTRIDTDAVIHQIKFDAPYQFASTKIVGDTLKIIFYENINLLIPKNGFNLSYALHLKEDFSSSSLINFNFTTIDSYGDVTYDWVDDNLNNVKEKAIKDTVVNGTTMTHIIVQRPFTFSKAFATSALASKTEDSLLVLKTDKIIFSSYVYFGKTYPATSTNTSLFYIKTN
jgi:hypothetical protein